MKRTILAATAVAALLPLLATAQFSKTEDEIRYRQSALFVMGEHFYGRIGPMANDKIPFDAARVRESAAIVRSMSTLPFAAFSPDSAKGNTKALPEIWKEQGKFTKAKDQMLATIPNLVAAADAGDKAKLKAASTETAAACKNCHDDFRGK